MRACWPLLLSFVGGASCTFADLGDYELEICQPAPRGGDAHGDACTRLQGPGVDECHQYRCEPTTRRCVLALRDDDRDDQASDACGGQDCDDANADVGRGFPELCQASGPYVDNDCDGVIDQGLGLELGEGAPVGGASEVRFEVVAGEVLASYVQKRANGQCIQALSPSGPAGSGCAFGPTPKDPGFLPRQPSVQPVGKTGFGVAYVETGAACKAGALGYRVFDATGVSAFSRLVCDAGAALPSLAVASNGRSATIVYLEAPLPSHDDAFDDCATLQPARLRVAQVTRADTNAALLSEPWPMALTDASLSVRAPALLRLNEQLVVVAPAEGGVKLWRLDETAGVADAGVAIAGLEGARSVFVADDRRGHLALVAQVGCSPQALRLALGAYDARSVRFEPSFELVAASSSLAADPRVTWLAERGEWLVTWLQMGPAIRALRLNPTGQPIGASFRLLEGAQGAAVDEAARVVGFEGSATDATFVRGALSCGADP